MPVVRTPSRRRAGPVALAAAGLLATAGLAPGALAADTPPGTPYSWGAETTGALGNDAALSGAQGPPAQIPGLGRVIDISAGYAHSLAVVDGGEVYAWGSDSKGQLGDGGATNTDQGVPVRVTGISTAVAVAAGGEHSLALLADGTVMAWGSDVNGALGDNATAGDKTTPVPVASLTQVKAISAGTAHSLALLTNGTVQA